MWAAAALGNCCFPFGRVMMTSQTAVSETTENVERLYKQTNKLFYSNIWTGVVQLDHGELWDTLSSEYSLETSLGEMRINVF